VQFCSEELHRKCQAQFVKPEIKEDTSMTIAQLELAAMSNPVLHASATMKALVYQGGA
jgi:hypothetical protein